MAKKFTVSFRVALNLSTLVQGMDHQAPPVHLLAGRKMLEVLSRLLFAALPCSGMLQGHPRDSGVHGSFKGAFMPIASDCEERRTMRHGIGTRHFLQMYLYLTYIMKMYIYESSCRDQDDLDQSQYFPRAGALPLVVDQISAKVRLAISGTVMGHGPLSLFCVHWPLRQRKLCSLLCLKILR